MARVLIVECMQEVSSFNPVASEYADFAIQRGEAMLAQTGLNTAVGGAIEEFGKYPDIRVAPVLSARAGSAGPLSAAGWKQLSHDILQAIAADEGPVDGLYFSMHGAMAADAELDPEGALLEAVREIVGDQAPIVISLDLHGILTARMLTNIDGLAVYHTYPHVDFADTGSRATRLLIDIIHGQTDPVIARVPIPALVRGEELLTATGCYGALIEEVRQLESDGLSLAAGLLIGNPFTDVPELCSQAFVITNGDGGLAGKEAHRLAEMFWRQRHRMQAKLVPISTAVAEAKSMKGPVILTDAADATSSGASGDSAEILGALLEAGYRGKVLAPLVDRAVAKAAHQAGVGATIEVTVGGSLDKRFTPVRLAAEVDLLSSGQAALETSGHKLDAGLSAILIADNLTLLVMSRPVSLFDRAMFFAHGRDPRSYDLIIVKSPYCEYHMFDEWSERNFNVDAPGATSADIPTLGHRNCQRPMFPIDRNFEFRPTPEIYWRAAGRRGTGQRESA